MSRVSLRACVGGALIAIAAGTAGVAVTTNTFVDAADHLDPPARTNPMHTTPGMDRNADIADVYAWHRGTGATASVVTIMTFSGPNMPTATQAIPCDRNVLYTIHISTNATHEAEHDIRARFGTDDTDRCFVSVEGIPGRTEPLVAPVERVTQSGDEMVFAGLRDDAFFFDLQGFRETGAMGTLRFMSSRDFFAGQNTPAIAIEFPLSAVSTAGSDFRVWGTTARIGS